MFKEILYPVMDLVRRPLRVRKEFFVTRGKRVLDLGAGDWRRGNIALDHDLTLSPDICGNATVLPLADTSMDVVICYHLVEHLTPEEYQQLVDEVSRVLKPGGMFYLLVERELSEEALFEKDPTHVYRYTREEVTEVVAEEFNINLVQSFNLVGNVNRFGPFFWNYLNREMKYYLELEKPST
jgi:ubiquinone/menaquinone biosynthesis C-methylase UbiE